MGFHYFSLFLPRFYEICGYFIFFGCHIRVFGDSKWFFLFFVQQGYGSLTFSDASRLLFGTSGKFYDVLEKFPGTPEKFRGTPEKFRGTLEKFPGTPEKFPGIPENFSGTPEKFREVPRL
jgi:hypothetical protein